MTSVQFISDVDSYTGYGRTAVGTMIELHRLQFDVRPMPLKIDRAGLPAEMDHLLRSAASQSTPDFVYYYAYPQALIRTVRARPLIANTMYEHRLLPDHWHSLLDQCDMLVAPSEFCASMFRSNGFTQPVRIIPEGIRTKVYPYFDRSDRGGSIDFRGLVVATAHARKHLPLTVEAWERAFGSDPTANLTIKVTPQTPDASAAAMLRSLARNNVSVVRRILTQEDVVSLYRRADVLLALGSEGYGLVPIEAMATGLCVIALDAEGQADLCGSAEHCLVPVPGVEDDEAGGTIPDVEATARALIEARDNPTQRLEVGQRASTWVASNRDIRAKARLVAELLRDWAA